MATGTAEQVAILRDAPLRSGAPSTKVKTKFPPGSTMENRLSSAVVGPAGGQLRMRSDYFTRIQLALGLWNWRSANELLVATAALKIAVGAVSRRGLRRRVGAEFTFHAGSDTGCPMGAYAIPWGAA